MKIGNAASPATVVLRSNPSIKATPFDPGKPLTRIDLPEVRFQDFLPMGGLDGYQAQLEKQGQMEQAMVIKKGGRIVGSVGRESGAMFQDGSIKALWDKTKGNLADFEQLLKKQGCQVDSYQSGSGPGYAEIHEMIHQESYETLIARQSLEYSREFLGRPGLPGY